jgi:pilus assembly protein CpaE
MNAPWKHQAREPFAAYLCDDASLDVLRPLVADMGWPRKNASAAACAMRCRRCRWPSPHILMVDLSESGDPLNDINALAEVCEPGTVVLATGQLNDVRLYRDLLASGIHDYILKPLQPHVLHDALAGAHAFFSRRVMEGSEARHVSTAIIGTRGGVGASTLATSLAWLFAPSISIPPPCSIWTSISAPARSASISSRAGA